MTKITTEQKRRIIRLTIIYGLIIFVFSILQSSFFSILSLFNATPNLMLIIVIGAAIYEDERVASVVGIAAGVFMEAQGGMGLPVLPLLLFLLGYMSGIITKQLSKDGFLIYLIYMLIGILAGSVITLIQTALFANNYNLPQIFINILLPEYLYTFILSIPCYLLFKLIKRRGKNTRIKKKSSIGKQPKI